MVSIIERERLKAVYPQQEMGREGRQNVRIPNRGSLPAAQAAEQNFKEKKNEASQINQEGSESSPGRGG